MKIYEVLASDKMVPIMLSAKKRKKNNPKRSKTTRLGSFIDMFGGMAGYPPASNTGKGFQV